MSRGSRRLLVEFAPSNDIVYAIRDLFTTDLAAGAVNNTNSEPGPGVRHVTDITGTGVLITGSKIRVIGDGTFGHEGFWLTPAITRASGLVIRSDFSSITASHIGRLGATSVADANSTGYNNVGIMQQAGTHYARRTTDGTSPNISVVSFTSGSFYTVLRANGRYILFDPLDGSDVQLWWWDSWDNTATLYSGAIAAILNHSIDVDNLLAPSSQFFNVGALALASDSFNRADGAMGNTDGAGHAEANGGSGKAWTDRLGTHAIATNKAAASALSGGVATVTIDAGIKDIVMEAALTRSGGNIGLISWTDASNYMLAYHNGTNAIMSETVAGVTNTRISAAATYSANAVLRLRRIGMRSVLYYNDLYIGTYGSTSAALTGTSHGLYTTDTGNTAENFVCFGGNGYNAIRQAA